MKKNPCKKEDAIAFVLVVFTLCTGSWLLLSTWKYCQEDSHTETLTRRCENAEQDVKAAKEKFQRAEDAFTNATHQFNGATDKFKRAIKPGAEPWWIFLHDHAKWELKKQAYLAAQQVLDKAVRIRKEAEQVRTEASREFREAKERLDNWKSQQRLLSRVWNDFMAPFWNTFITPLLHFLLGCALLSFSARVVFRYLLLKEKIGVAKL